MKLANSHLPISLIKTAVHSGPGGVFAVIWASLFADINIRMKGTRGQSAHSRNRELAEEQTLAPGTSQAFDSTVSLWACLL